MIDCAPYFQTLVFVFDLFVDLLLENEALTLISILPIPNGRLMLDDALTSKLLEDENVISTLSDVVTVNSGNVSIFLNRKTSRKKERMPFLSTNSVGELLLILPLRAIPASEIIFTKTVQKKPKTNF